MQSLEELQAALEATKKKLEEERKQMAEQLKKEREEMLLLAQAERSAQLEVYQKKMEALEHKRKAEEEAAEKRRAQELTARLAAEQAQYKADEEYRKYHEKLEEVKSQIAEAEFQEEKHRKALEDAKHAQVVPEAFPVDDNITSDYPQTGAEGAQAAAGTEGHTQETPLMSQHLKQILRQAHRG